MKSFFLTFTAIVCLSINNSKAQNMPSDKWKLGVALWTFHTFPLDESIRKVDSAGLHYIEGSQIQKGGVEIEQSSVMQLSDDGIKKLNAYMTAHHIKMPSIYLFGGNTLDAWIKGFDLAKRLNVEFVTAEPSKAMWNSVDSLAGVYKLKVALHNHWKGMSIYWHPDSVLAAIKNHPNFAACPDLGHWPKSGIDAVTALKKLQGHILAIHLKDADQMNNVKANDVNIGTGVVDFKAVAAELKRQHYKGYIYIERDANYKPSNLPSVIEEVKYFNSIF
ncbi:MAG TPA: sugar phosphate isomerase/epimerase family protein [Mucilaginibacter sp.]|jgi:sugar phosphate isomerase/epimerase